MLWPDRNDEALLKGFLGSLRLLLEQLQSSLSGGYATEQRCFDVEHPVLGLNRVGNVFDAVAKPLRRTFVWTVAAPVLLACSEIVLVTAIPTIWVGGTWRLRAGPGGGQCGHGGDPVMNARPANG